MPSEKEDCKDCRQDATYPNPCSNCKDKSLFEPKAPSEEKKESMECLEGLKTPPDEMLPRIIGLLIDNGYDYKQSVALFATDIEFIYKKVLEIDMEVVWQPRGQDDDDSNDEEGWRMPCCETCGSIMLQDCLFCDDGKKWVPRPSKGGVSDD